MHAIHRHVPNCSQFHRPDGAVSKSYYADIMQITHLDGVDSLPFMYGVPETHATMSIDHRNYLLCCRGECDHVCTDGTFNDFFWSVRELWAEVAIFSFQGRDRLDGKTGWRHWDLRLVRARARTKWTAVTDPML
jgi:hypothetical protein